MNTYVGAGRWTGGTLAGMFRRSEDTAPWERLGAGLPDGLGVQAITVHPDDPRVVFAGTADGLYRSDDAGDRWRRLPTPAGLQIWSVAVHPTQRSRVYAGTSPVGVLRSDDGGASWRALPVPASQRVKMAFACRVMRLAVDPYHPDHVYAALEVGGAMRSLDAGENWADCADSLVELAQQHPQLRSRLQSDTDNEGMLDAHALCVSGARADTVFIAVRMGLFRSTDAGMTWRDLQVGRFSPLTYARDVRVSPHDPNVLLACLSPAAASKDGSLYRSNDLGETWRRLDRGVQARATMMAVALHPSDPLRIVCASRCGQVFTSVDAGDSWSESLLPEGVLEVYAVACG